MSGARPFRPAVAVLALNAVARAHEAPSQPQAVFAAVDHALAGEIGHRLFTILSYDRTAAWPRGCIRTCPTPTPRAAARP